MTIAVTRNLPDRFNGFIKSCMHEITPSVFVVPNMNKSVRERLWKVLLSWERIIPRDGGVVLLWKSTNAPSGLEVRTLGWPKKELIEYEGMWLTFNNLGSTQKLEELNQLLESKTNRFDSDDPLMEQY